MRRVIVLLATVMLSTGCALERSVLPKEYSGPTALIADSSYVYSNSKSDFFFVDAIDGQPIANALERTANANRGNGFYQHVQGAARPIEPKETIFHLCGRTHFAAPIQAMVGTSYYVDGSVKFTPLAGATYIVKGSLGPDYSAVWIENLETGVQVGNKLMIKGAAEMSAIKKRPVAEEIPPAP